MFATTRALLFSSLLLAPTLAHAEERSRPRLEFGAAGLASVEWLEGSSAFTGGGIVRGGVRTSALALSLEANAEVGSHWGETTARLGGYAAASWVHDRLRLGGGLGAAHRSVAATDIDFQFIAKTLAIGPMVEASVDVFRTDNLEVYVGARARADLAITGFSRGAVVPGAQLWLGFCILR